MKKTLLTLTVLSVLSTLSVANDTEYPLKRMSSNLFHVESEAKPITIDTTEQYQKLVKTLKDFEDSTSLEFGKFKVVKIDSSIYTVTIYGVRFDICESIIVNANGKFATKKEVKEIDFVINLMIKLLEKERNI